MKAELKILVQDLRKFLASQEEDDLTLKAAPYIQAAFKVLPPKTDTIQINNHVTEEEPMPIKKPAPSKAAALKQHLPSNPQKPVKQTPQATLHTEEKQPATPQPATMADKQTILEEIAANINTCQRCDLGQTRIKAVPGEGNINATLMFVGEGPGYEEDRQGRPFVGRAGQLLDKIIGAMGFTREEVFIANIVKCHPMIDPSAPEKHGNDRAPKPEEIAVCRRYLEAQIVAISPTHIVALGGVAAKALIKDSPSLAAIRGKIYDLDLVSLDLPKPVKILATYHPAALLRNPNWKKDCWADLKVLLNDMGRIAPAAEIPTKKKVD